ncbi:hypothetical protein CEXT_738911 [Caerostris extrusa]|uniref:Uncharacterized protein n=1 Tax=Caerostris extrusa TaxID=172846 RepID=A0AAV4WBG3_CAEEX|nr:hypothetical protein CEXT_738911 [Caerostris extrusa]
MQNGWKRALESTYFFLVTRLGHRQPVSLIHVFSCISRFPRAYHVFSPSSFLFPVRTKDSLIVQLCRKKIHSVSEFLSLSHTACLLTLVGEPGPQAGLRQRCGTELSLRTKESLIVQLCRKKSHSVSEFLSLSHTACLLTLVRTRPAGWTPSALRNRAQLCDTGP